jgi:hypothetical protein
MNLFSPRLLAGWIGAALITFALSLYFMMHGDTGATVGTSSYSRSAIGHEGLAEMLRRLGVAVVQSRDNSLKKAGKGGVLVVAEPELPLPGDPAVEQLLHARHVLLVLPKWAGTADSGHAGWIDLAIPLAEAQARWTLELVDKTATVARLDGVDTWNHNDLDIDPILTAPVQLIKSAALTPIVGSEAGILLGEIKDKKRTVWVLSDPDLIDNHGLGIGNAAFAAALIDRLRSNGPVVFDETIHGFPPAGAKDLSFIFRKPFLATTVQAALGVALLLWATLGRFGLPETAPAPLKAGKAGLIRNAARLLAYAGHQPAMVLRYVDATIRDVAARLHAPAGLPPAGLAAWLREAGGAGGAAVDFAQVRTAAEALAGSGSKDMNRLFGVARDIRRWKREMIDGPSGHPRDHRSHPRRGAESRGRPG